MKSPPDLSFSLDKTKTIKNTTFGPKYLIMKRINNESGLNQVSPFLVKKVIDSVAGSEVEMCKKLKNGTILIKTKTSVQAMALVKLTSLNSTIEIDISEHNTLNFTKGVVYCNDLRGISEEDIQLELANQNVCEVKKILKKNNNELQETGLVILKFSCSHLPSEINIGYQKIRIRPYIPLPLRCRKCQKYGHLSSYCTANQVCINCSETYHLKNDEEICTLPKCCINCKNWNQNCNHSSIDKTCPTFLREKEIQAIITLEKMDRKKAQITYNQRHPAPASTYSQISNINAATSLKSPSAEKPKTVTLPLTTNNQERKTVSYSDVLPTATTSNTGKKINSIKILPKKTSKRTIDALRKIEKRQKVLKTLKDSDKKPDDIEHTMSSEEC